MAIEAIEKIPFKEKPKSKAAQIREDVQEALLRHIGMFEFVGEIYNNKGTAGRIREVSWPLFKDYFVRYAKTKTKLAPCKNFNWIVGHDEIHKMYKVSWFIDENEQFRVFMTIDFDFIDAYASEIAKESDWKQECRENPNAIEHK